MKTSKRLLPILLSIAVVLAFTSSLAFANSGEDQAGAPQAGEGLLAQSASGQNDAAGKLIAGSASDAIGGLRTADDGESEDGGRWSGSVSEGTIAPGETKDVVIANARDYASFEFKPTVSGWYSFYSNGDHDTYGRVLNDALDQDADPIAANDDSGYESNFNVVFQAEAGGTYYLQASMYGMATGEFSVYLGETEEPSEPDKSRWSGNKQTGTIELGETKEVTIESAYDYASYEFVPAESGWYSFRSDGSEDTYGRVLDSGEYEITDNDDGNDVSGYNFNVVFEAEAGEAYYLEASLYGSGTGSFTVEVIKSSQPSGGGDDDDDDDDDANWDVDYSSSSYGMGRTFNETVYIEESGSHGTLTGYWYRTQNGSIIDEDADNPLITSPLEYDDDEDEPYFYAELPVEWPSFRLIIVETDESGTAVARRTRDIRHDYEYEPAPGDNVNSVTFVPVQAIDLKFHKDGEFRNVYGNDAYGHTVRYFEYLFPGFKEGDKLVVEYNDGKGEVAYEYRENAYNEETGKYEFDDSYSYHFVNPADETGEDVISFDECFAQNQEEEWEPNTQHAFTTHVWRLDATVECPVNIVADTSAGEFEYEAINGSYAKIIRYNGTDKAVSVPSTIGGFAVQEIGESAFSCTGVTSVTLPDTVEVVGQSAFDSCKSLASVGLGKGLTTIGNYAFYGCGGIASFNLPSTLTKIGYRAFGKCIGVTSFALPDSVKEIGQEAFSGITGLKTVNYPKSLETTDGNLFAGDEQITSFVVPEGVTVLADSVFEGCKYLTSVTLPTSLEEIGSNAFEGCSALEAIDLPPELKRIGSGAFYECDGLTAVQLPDTVTYIGTRAFACCDSLNSINYPMSLDSTGGYLFEKTPKLKEVTVPDGVLSLAYNVFSGSAFITKVNLPEGLKVIEGSAFEGCAGISSLTLPDSVEEIGSSAIAGCTNLASLNYPRSLRSCSWNWLNNSPKLKTMTVPDGITFLPTNAFDGADGLVTVVLPDSLETIGESAFDGCASLRKIEIPDSVSSIGEDAFYRCSSLMKIKIPASTVSIASYAFGQCTKLEAIWIGPQVTSIAGSAFNNCSTDTLVIYGAEGSYAQTWATEHGYQFSAEDLPVDESGFSGKVTDADGNGIEGIGVLIYDDLEKRVAYREYTDASGEWFNEDIVQGREYTISYSCANYRFSANDFKETADVNVVIDTVIAERIISDLEETPASDFRYEVVNGNNIAITGYTGSSDRISIPSVIGEYSVVSIGESAFANSALATVVIPEGVTEIGTSAFYNCNKLTAVMLPSTLTKLGGNTFYNCRFEEINLPLGLQNVGYSAFSQCTALKAVYIPDTVTNLGQYAFADCANLEQANYPLALESAGTSIFSGCVKLTSFTLPDGVTQIAGNAFSYSALIKIELPDSITAIGPSAFKGCAGLTGIELPEGLKSLGYDAFYGCSGLTSIHLPDSVTSIGSEAFAYCTSLEEINYPLSLESGGSGMLRYDTKITEITVPEGVTALAAYAFESCENLTKVNLPESLTTIGSNAFYNCTGLTTIDIPASVTSIGYYAFRDCTGFTEIAFPPHLQKIGSNAFDGCTGLTSIELPDTITYLGYKCFANCSNLEQANYPLSLTETGGGVFADDPKLTEITVPEGVTVLAKQAFSSCANLETVHLPDSLTEIGASAFAECKALANITIPSGVQKIGNNAFSECVGLKSVEVPDSVTEIGNSAFYKCSNIEEIKLPDALTTIGSSVFAYCTSLRKINYPVSLTSVGGNIFAYDSSLNSIVVPEGVTTLPENAFDYAAFLTNVELPSTLTTIGRSAFYGCNGLTSITVPDSVETIGRYAFDNCKNLSSFGYPKSLKSCGEYIFYGDSKLRSITVPEGVTELPQNVFAYADGLVTVKLPETLTKIGDSAFYQCTALKRVVIPDSVTTIEQHAFNGCRSLVKAVIPAGTTQIAYRVFRDNTSLEAIWIGEQVTSINNNAFDGCSTDKLVIHGVAGSVANAFANNKGYAFLTDEVVISDNTVTGVVVDTEGNGIDGVTVTAFDDLTGEKAFKGLTDADGRWECSELTSGKKYTVSYGKTNYSFSANQIAIEAGTDTEVETVTAEKIIADLAEGDQADFTYTAINGTEIRITGYTGSATKLQIPETINDMKVTVIGGYAFSSSTVTHLAIPEGVTQIGDYAFAGCASIRQVLLPSTLEVIGESAFENCASLESAELPYGLTTIEHAAFRKTGLASVDFPDTVTSIGTYAFADCESLAHAGYPLGARSTGGYVFYNDPKLTMVEVPAGVKRLASNLFSYSGYLTSVVLPDSLKEIGDWAFQGCDGLTSIRIPDGVTTLGWGVFGSCSNLAVVNYPASLATCGSAPFSGCGKLKTVNIPDGVKTIVNNSLSYTEGLAELEIPDSVEVIDEYAFYSSEALTTVKLPASLKTVGRSAFNGCKSLRYAIYPGTEDEWNANVSIGDYNSELGNALVFNGGQGQITPPVAPDLFGEAYGHKQVRLVWGYSGDEKLVKRYAIYRSSNGITYSALRSVSGSTYEYIDKLSFTGESKTYSYKIVVVDKYDRTKESGIVSVAAVSTDHEPPVAVITPGKNSYVRAGDDCRFSAAMSTDNDAIASYKWRFDDGTNANGREVAHKFINSGTYNVTLEVTDVNGNAGSTSAQVTAIDPNDPNYTLLKLTVCDSGDANQKPVKGAQVSITQGDATDTFEADSNGQVVQLVRSGDYVVSAAANGYLPRTVKIVAEGGVQESILGLATKSIMSGSINVSEMTYDEIVAAGIDVNAPGNGHVYEFETHLTFVAGIQTYDFPINIFKNENNEVVKKDGGGFFNIGNPYTPGGDGLRIGIFPISEKFVLVIYGEVHWLKEMYKVELVVNNNSSTDTLEDIHGELMLPDGMSLADMVSGAQSAEHDLGNLGYNSSTSTEWYIRGDKEGEYNIKARVTATAMPYGDVLEQVYETESPVKVYAGSALHLTITCPDQAERGKEYTVKYKLENVSDKSLYNLSFGITGSKQYKVIGFGTKESKPMPITTSEYGEAWTRKVDELAPGGYIELDISTTIWFNSALELVAFSKLGAFVDIAYYLTDVSMVTAESNTTDIPYNIVIERAERPNLIDKVLPDVVEKFLEKFGIEFPGDSLGGTLIEWLGEDVLGMESAKGAKTWLKLAQGTTESKLVVEIDDGRGEADSIQNDVVRVSSGTLDQEVFSILNGNKIKTGVDGVTITAKGPGTTRLKIGVENKFGELEREYTVDYVVNGNETKSTLTVSPNGTTKKYVCDEDNFSQTIEKHRAMELQEYLKNPFQQLDDSMIIDITGHTKDTNYTVQLTEKQVNDLLDTTINSLDVKGKIANVSYSREALTRISTKGGMVDLSVEKLTAKQRQDLGTINPVYRFTATTTADPRWDFSGGPVTITVPYEIIGEENQKNVKVRHIKSDGSEEMLDAVYNTGSKSITFETNSFSHFEIVGKGHDNAEEAAEVTSLITKLPAVNNLTYNDRARVKAALAAYNKLTAAGKAQLGAEAVKALLASAKRIEALEKAYKANNGLTNSKLPKPKIKTPTAGKKYLKAKWKKLTASQKKAVQGIEVEYSTSKTFKTSNKFKTVKKSAGSVKIKKLKSKKTYYVRARTYIVKSGVRYVSPWSAKKKVKVK